MGGGTQFPLAPVLAASEVATLGPVAAQATATGREIHKLATWGRKLYASYGDYNANTGSIGAVSVDLDTLTVVDEATLSTEETWDYRVLGGKLYVPFFDPQQGTSEPLNGQYAVATAPGAWSIITTVTPVAEHAFDMASTSEGLWLAGSTDIGTGGGIVWKSTDDGATWAADHTIGASNPFARVYCLVSLGDDLIAGGDDGSGHQLILFRPSGGTWQEIASTYRMSELTSFTVGSVPMAIATRAGTKEDGHVGTFPVQAAVFSRPSDAVAAAAFAATIPGSLGAIASSASDLYALAGRVIWHCDSAGTWTRLGRLGLDATALAVDPVGGYLYFGTTDSRILRAPIPA